MTLFVGIDVSAKDFKVRVLNSTGEEPAKRFKAENNLPGSQALIDYLLPICRQYHISRVVFGLESTSIYSWHLQMFLAEQDALASLAPQVYVFNPKVVANFKKAYVDLSKDDWTDAWVIADRLRFGRLPEHAQVDFRYLPLQRLTRFRCHLVQTITREKNYFLSNLFLKFCSLSQDGVFSNCWGATAEAVLLEFFSPEEIASQSLDELIDFLIDNGKNHFSDPAKTALALKHAAQRAYRLKASFLEPINLILATSLETIRTLESQVKKIDRAIANELSHFPSTLSSLPGLGPVFVAGLIAEIGDIRRFPEEASLAKYAGLTWRTHQSGNFSAEDTPLTKTGNAYLRNYFVQSANSVRQFEPVFREFYARKVAESSKHAHRRALVLTARKLVRVVDALLRTHQVYLPQGGRRI